jgi:phosphohistidine phosphatase SixA
MPKTILLLRHAEEPRDPSDVDLSKAGRKSAAKLAAYIPRTYGKPDVLYAAAASESSVRSYLTLRPLAAAMTKVIDASHPSRDFARLATRILGDPTLADKMVVICWTHKELPSLAAYLNVRPEDFPAEWDETDYDRIFRLTYKGSRQPKVKRAVQPF